jgi:hypothetical protein
MEVEVESEAASLRGMLASQQFVVGVAPQYWIRVMIQTYCLVRDLQVALDERG